MNFSDYGIDLDRARGHGDQVRMPCPKCSPDRKKSGSTDLAINKADGVWICHHCGARGCLDTGWDGEDRPVTAQAAKRIYQKRDQKKVREYKKPQAHALGLTTECLEWFRARGIHQHVLEEHRIGFGPHFFVALNEKRGAIQFPYYRNGELVNIKYRTRDKHFQLFGGAERTLYGIDTITDGEVIICEGEMDALSFYESAFRSVVSVPDGAPPPNAKGYATKFDFIESASEQLEPLDKIILAVDADAPGRALADELARRLGQERCWFVTWPDDCKDCNDVLVKYGADAVRSCVMSATPWPIDDVERMETIEPRLWDMFNGVRVKSGAKTGWNNVSDLYRVKTGELTVVTGIPGHFKSLWVSALTVNLVKTEGWRFAFFSPEHAVDRMSATICEQWSGKMFKPNRIEISEPELEDAIEMQRDHYVWIRAENGEPTLDHVLDRARTQVVQFGINGLVVDPWNELEHTRPQGLSEQEYISRALSKLRKFAEVNDVHVWLIAHPTKMQKAPGGSVYAGKEPPPTPYDIASSANFRNKASNCITVWRDAEEDSDIVEIHVMKIKFEENGRLGMGELKLNRRNAQFADYFPEMMYE